MKRDLVCRNRKSGWFYRVWHWWKFGGGIFLINMTCFDIVLSVWVNPIWRDSQRVVRDFDCGSITNSQVCSTFLFARLMRGYFDGKGKQSDHGAPLKVRAFVWTWGVV